MYDFENHLISANGITYTYDGHVHRISKTANDTTITFATSDINPAGYSQVLQERLELRQHYDNSGNNRTQTMYFAHDGHGSVRAVTDQNGAVTDTYDYAANIIVQVRPTQRPCDAFGVLIHQTGTTPDTTLYSGEQFDPDLNLYYNRARYLSVSTGRFWSMDTFEGDAFAPISLHKYLYASTDPVNRVDPEGQEDADVSSNLISASGQTILATIAIVSAVAAVCTIDYELGRDDCFDRNPDRERTFYHGTTLLDAQEAVQNQAFNVVRKIARQKNPSILDFGSGLYMTDSLQTAGISREFRGSMLERAARLSSGLISRSVAGGF